MAKTAETTSTTPDTERATQAVEKFESWKNDLKVYWPDIDAQQEMYEFYKSEDSETSSDVSLNTPFSIVESMVAKANDSTLSVTVDAVGTNGMDDFEAYLGSVLKNAIEDADVAAIYGTFRKIREMHTREFLVKGNAISETNYCYQTQLIDGKKVVIADNPYTTVLDYKSYVFDSSYQFDNAPEFFLEKYVSLDDLLKKEYKEIESTDKKGKKTTQGTGIYTNLAALKDSLDKDNLQSRDHESQTFISGDSKVKRKVGPIRLLEHWTGAKLEVIANDSVIIRSEYDPKKTGNAGVARSMNYKLVGRPYAYGEIAAIYKAVRAQDTILNQGIESVNRFLRPAILINDPDADVDSIIEVMEAGGVAVGNAQALSVIPTNTPPPALLQTIDTLQQAIERAARYSPYAVGVPSQQTDQTAGTATGITRLQQAAEPNFQVKLDTIQDSFMQPIGRDYFKMIGRLMGPEELRYGALKSKDGKWVTATKGILTGHATIEDLLVIGMITPQMLPDFLAEAGIELTPGQPIESALESVVFDVDWLIGVKLDSQSDAAKQQEIQEEMSLIQYGQQMGVQFSPERVINHLAKKQGLEDIEDLLLTPEEQQQQAQQMQLQQQQQMQQQQMQQQTQNQHDQQMQQQQTQAQSEQQQQQQQGQLQLENLKQMGQLAQTGAM